MSFELIHAECLEWLTSQKDCSFHAVATDPPFGPEYEPSEIQKLRDGHGGQWRIPPPKRKALPRFSTLSGKDLEQIQEFFEHLAVELFRVLKPGGHVCLAANPLVSPWVFGPFNELFERRGEIIRLIQTLRGGDRPKGAEEEFSDVCVMPRSAYEPWGLFRKPISEATVALNLRKWGTGGLRRESSERPFTDVIDSRFPTKKERDISDHPSLKPQSWLRPLVRALLPLGYGRVLDPFAGSGSTLAATHALGADAIGVERDAEFHRKAMKSIPSLAELKDDLLEREVFDWLMNQD